VKVVFIEDVPNVAEVGEIKEVSDGYGRNFLLPRQLAVLASSQASHIVKAKLKIKAQREAQLAGEMAVLAKQLGGTDLTLKARVGSSDRLYGSVTNADIAAELHNVTGIEIDRRKIELAEPIRTLGKHEVEVKLFKDITCKINVTVVADEEKKAEEGEEEVKGKKAKARRKKEGDEEATVPEDAVEGVKSAEEPAEGEEKPEAKKRKKKAKAEVEVVAEAPEAEAPETKKRKKKAKAEAEVVAEAPEAETETEAETDK